MGILTIGVVTKPFDFERQQKMNTALKGIAEMRKHVDALIIIPNQRLLKINEQAMTATSAFAMVDDVLYKVVKSISELLNNTSYMNVDFADLESVLKDSGDAHIAIGTGTGDDKAEEAVQQIINSPLLETTIDNAGKILVHVTMSEDTILTDLDVVIDKLTAAAHPDVEVISGCEVVSDMKDTIIVTVVATSFMDSPGIAGKNSARAATPDTSNFFATGPINSGQTQQLHDARNVFGSGIETSRVEPLDKFITQNLDSSTPDDDPFQALQEIFKK
jgi:cell division protein FtsZ